MSQGIQADEPDLIILGILHSDAYLLEVRVNIFPHNLHDLAAPESGEQQKPNQQGRDVSRETIQDTQETFDFFLREEPFSSGAFLKFLDSGTWVFPFIRLHFDGQREDLGHQ